MKKTITLLLIASVGVCAYGQGKFDAAGALTLKTYNMQQSGELKEAPWADMLPVDFKAAAARGDSRFPVFVKLAPGASADDLTVRGFEIQADFGDIVVARGEMSEIEALEKCDFVKALSFGEKREPQMQNSRAVTGAQAIQDGTAGFKQAYTGKGVVTGIFDTGIDSRHVNFLGDDGNSRIKAVWWFSGQEGTCSSFTTPEELQKFTTDNSGATHGTHTLGCMAGSWKGNGARVAYITGEEGSYKGNVSNKLKRYPNPYYGMAPSAEIVAGAGALYDPNIATGIANVRDYIVNSGKPGVMNLSIGSLTGPHDGSDMVTQAMERAGKDMIIFISSSNNGDVNVSLTPTFTAANPSVASLLSCPNNYSGTLDIWSDDSEPVDVTVQVYDLEQSRVAYEYAVPTNKEVTGFAIGNSNVGGVTISPDAFQLAFSSSYCLITTSRNTDTNNRFNVRIYNQINYNASTNASRRYVLGVKIAGKAGHKALATINAKDAAESNVEFASMDQPGYVNGNPDFSINSMACGKNVIAVGSWNARNIWPTLDGGIYTYVGGGYEVGAASPFSSYGTLLDGRTLPDVCAPGTAIVSSISTYYVNRVKASYSEAKFNEFIDGLSAEQTVNGTKYYYEAQQGTSMASPICAGGVALWLEADPTLNVDEVREIIKETADRDEFVPGNYPAAKWGAGKFNALKGLAKVLNVQLGVNDAMTDDQRLIINQSDGAIEVLVAGESSLTATLYSISGSAAAQAQASGNTVTVATDGLAPGVYVLAVQGATASYTRKVVVK